MAPINDYRDLIRVELRTRQSKNRRYSLRALARDLGVSSGHLSLVLDGKRKISTVKAGAVARRLGFSEARRRLFVCLVQFANAQSDEDRQDALRDIKRYSSGSVLYRVLKREEFELISAWYHHAIVEMTKLKGIEFEPKTIAKKLGITTVEAEHAITRLLRVGLLSRDGKRLISAKPYHYGEHSDDAVRQFHKVMLARAQVALDLESFTERDFANVTIAIEAKSYPEIVDRIRGFMREIMHEYRTDSATNVYQLSTQLFRLV